MLPSEFLHALFAKVDGPKNLRILWFKTIDEAFEAGADFIVEVRRELSRRLQLSRPCL